MPKHSKRLVNRHNKQLGSAVLLGVHPFIDSAGVCTLQEIILGGPTITLGG